MTSYPQKLSKRGLKKHRFFGLLGKSGFLHFFKTVPPTSVTFCVLGQSMKNDHKSDCVFLSFFIDFVTFSCFFHDFCWFFVFCVIDLCYTSVVFVSSYYDVVWVTYLCHVYVTLFMTMLCHLFMSCLCYVHHVIFVSFSYVIFMSPYYDDVCVTYL